MKSCGARNFTFPEPTRCPDFKTGWKRMFFIQFTRAGKSTNDQFAFNPGNLMWSRGDHGGWIRIAYNYRVFIINTIHLVWHFRIYRSWLRSPHGGYIAVLLYVLGNQLHSSLATLWLRRRWKRHGGGRFASAQEAQGRGICHIMI